MKMTYRLSKKGRKVSDRITVYEIIARLHSGHIDRYAHTGVNVPRSYTDISGNTRVTWKDGQIVSPRSIRYADPEQVQLKKILDDAKARLLEMEKAVDEASGRLAMENGTMGPEWLQDAIDGTVKNVRSEEPKPGRPMCDIYEEYVADPRLMVSPNTRRQYASMVNNLRRFEKHTGQTLTLDGITQDTLRDFEAFLVDELGNSQNSASRRMKRLRSFVRWANGLNADWPIEPLTRNNPFANYRIREEQYGTPFYLTIEERNRLETFSFPPRIARQRDIFVFQCLVGCRISDLWAMTKNSVTDGVSVEYIPRKTKDNRPITVRVPLNSRAKAIADRYADNGDPRLFPFTAQQQYNEDIKAMLKAAGINRMVTVINKKTREEEKKPICDVASSHTARKTFIGNLYKKVKDPNLVGKLSGHAENSRAFVRYRDIDDEMAEELVQMLE